MNMKTMLSEARIRPVLLIASGCAFLFVSALLIVGHVRLVQEVRDVSLPTLSQIPVMERRLDVLKQQVETAQLHAALTTGSQEERVYVYVLPEQPDLDRLIAIFDLLRDNLKRSGWLSSMSAIEVRDDVSPEELSDVHHLNVTMTLHEEGLRRVLILLRLAGLLTVGDALTPEEYDLLVQRTEAENPAGIVAVEDFLSTDILEYVRNSRPYEDQLLRSFASPTFERVVQSITATSLLRDARILFEGSLGETFASRSLWPLPFVTVEHVSQQSGGTAGWYTVSLELGLHTRTMRK